MYVHMYVYIYIVEPTRSLLRARRAQEIYNGIISWNCIIALYHGNILRKSTTELECRITSRTYITELYHVIVLLTYISTLYYGIILWNYMTQ